MPRRESDAPIRVLSSGADDPEYDVEIARLLLARRPAAQYVVVSTHEGYSSVPTRHRDFGDSFVVCSSGLSDWDGVVGADKSGKFDLVLLTLWSGPTAKLSAAEQAAAVITWSAARCGPGATLVALRPGSGGVFRLRALLQARLLDRPEGGAGPSPDDLEPGALPLSASLASAGLPSWVERLDSQVNISSAVGEELTAAGARLLQDLLGVDMELLAQREPALTESVVDELCDMTLSGDGFSAPVVVYTPIHAVVAVAPGGARPGTGTSSARAGGAAAASSSSAAAAAAGRGAALPAGCATIAEARAVPRASASALFAAEPARVVESEETQRRAALDLLRSTHGAAAAGKVGEEDPLYFYLRMRGAWGNFTGTGAGDVVRASRAAHDDAYLHGGGPTTVVPDGIRGPRAAEKAMMAVPHDPWYPHGLRGGFFNSGLRNWNEMRSSWLSRPPGFVMPPYPGEVDSEEVIEQLAKLQRTYTLPGPMRLPDVIDLYLDIWEEELSGM